MPTSKLNLKWLPEAIEMLKNGASKHDVAERFQRSYKYVVDALRVNGYGKADAASWGGREPGWWYARAVEMFDAGVSKNEICETFEISRCRLNEVLVENGRGRVAAETERSKPALKRDDPRGRWTECQLGRLTKAEREMVAAARYEDAMYSAMQRAGVPL